MFLIVLFDRRHELETRGSQRLFGNVSLQAEPCVNYQGGNGTMKASESTQKPLLDSPPWLFIAPSELSGDGTIIISCTSAPGPKEMCHASEKLAPAFIITSILFFLLDPNQ